MPSFSLLRRSNRSPKRSDRQEAQSRDNPAGNGDGGIGQPEGNAASQLLSRSSTRSGRQRKGSKRELFHDLISRSRLARKPPSTQSPTVITPQRGREGSSSSATPPRGVAAVSPFPCVPSPASSNQFRHLLSTRPPPICSRPTLPLIILRI